jgi:hypothetical protein
MFSNALENVDEGKQRRQLTDLQIQAETMKLNNQKKLNDELEGFQKLLGDAPEFDIQKMLPYNDAIRESEDASKSGKDWKPSNEHKEAIITASIHSPFITDDPSKINEQAEAAHYLNSFMTNNAGKLPQGRHVLNEDNAPELIANVNKFYEKQINQGFDKTGLDVNDGVDKKVKSVLVNNEDPSNPKISFILNVTTPVKDGQVFKHIGDNNPKFTVNDEMTSKEGNEPGNIDLSQRPVRRNADGSVSTVLSSSFEIDGKNVLLPLINDKGKLLTKEEAINEFKKTGKHLGKFKSEEDAIQYAQALHSDPIWNEDIKKYSAKGQKEVSYDAPLSLGRDANPNAPVAQVPASLMQAQVSQISKTLAAAQKIMMLSNPAEFVKDYSNRIVKREADKQVMSILRSVPKNLKPQERVDWLNEHKPEGIDWKDWTSIVEPKGSITPLDALKLNQGERKLNLLEKGEEDKKVKAEEDRKEKVREFDLKEKDVKIKQDDLKFRKSESAETKKEKGVNEELGKLEGIRKDMETQANKSGNRLKKVDPKFINGKIEKMIEYVKKGKTATEARTLVEKEDMQIKEKNDALMSKSIAKYTEDHPPEKYKGMTSPDGKLKSDGNKWTLVNP